MCIMQYITAQLKEKEKRYIFYDFIQSPFEFPAILMKRSLGTFNSFLSTGDQTARVTQDDATLALKQPFMRSIYIRIVSSLRLLSALINWFKLVYVPFGQSSVHRTFGFCLNQPRAKSLLTVLVHAICIHEMLQLPTRTQGKMRYENCLLFSFFKRKDFFL